MKSSSVLLLLVASCLVASAFALEKSDCECRTRIAKRIVGGQRSERAYPWFATIRSYNATQEENPARNLTELQKKIKLQCGAVILNEWWVVTTAECVFYQKFLGGDYVVQYGSNNLTKMFDEKKHVHIAKNGQHPHPAYNHSTGLHNVGLIKLATPLNFSDTVQPACLPNANFADYKDYLHIVGFGTNVSATFNYQNASFDVNPWEHIQTTMKVAFVLDNTRKSLLCKGTMQQNICVRPADHKKSTEGTHCLGDIGAPMHEVKNGRNTVVGLFALSGTKQMGSKYQVKICDDDSKYTRLSYYVDWIRDNADHQACQLD